MKFIDLYDPIMEHFEKAGADAKDILTWLDEHPELTGGTLTESEAARLWYDANNSIRDAWPMSLQNHGITVTPDPEPTNAELIERKLRELRKEPGEWMTYATDSDISGFSQALDAKGVVAPGANDE